MKIKKQKKQGKGKGKQGKRQRLPSMQVMLKEADAAFSRFIRERDDWKCVICGSLKKPQCGHLIRRSKLNVRFDERNCNCQCANCNYRHEWFPEHYFSWFVSYHGSIKDALLILYTKAYFNPRKRFSRGELQFITDSYKVRYNQECRNKATLKF